MTQDLETSVRGADARAPQQGPADPQASTRRAGRDTPTADTSPAAGARKTSIEMAFEVLREAEAKGRSANAKPEWPPARSDADERWWAAEFELPELPPEPPGNATPPASEALLTPPSISTPPPAHAGPHEWSSSHRKVRYRTIAGAAIALLIGAGAGYMMGSTSEPVLGAKIGTFDGGMRLRLDPNLRQP